MILETKFVPTRFRDKDGAVSFEAGVLHDYQGRVNGVPRYAIIVTNRAESGSTDVLEVVSATGNLLDVVQAQNTKIYTTAESLSVRGASTNSATISGVVSELEFDLAMLDQDAVLAGAAPAAGSASGGTALSGVTGSAPATTYGSSGRPTTSYQPQ